MLAEPIAQKNPPPQWATPNRPLCGGAPPPPMWATPHRLRRGRIDEMDTSRKPSTRPEDGLPCKHFADEHPRHGRRAHGRGQRAHDGQARERRDCERPFKRCRAHGFRSVERLQGPEAQGCKIPAGQCRVCIHCCGAHWKRRADADGRVRHHASDRPCWSGGLSQEHGHQPDAWCQPLSCISSHHRAEAACSAQACAGGGRRGRRCGRGQRRRR